MKIRVLIVFLCGVIHFSSAQDIVQAEYFFDVDPGPGNANALSVISGSVVDERHVISTSGLGEGLHFLHVRVKDSNGKWSLYQKKPLSVHSAGNALPVTDAEYFFDEDPGVGNGISLAVDDASSMNENYAVSTEGLQAGLHFLHIRVKNSDDKWSLYDRKIVSVSKPDSSSPIVEAEYFIDTVASVNSGISMDLQAANNIHVSQGVALPEDHFGIHFMHIRVKNDEGVWSHYARSLFSAFTPEPSPPIVAYTYVIDSTSAPGDSLFTAISPAGELNVVDTLNPVMEEGRHFVYARVTNEVGSWSQIAIDSFEVASCAPVLFSGFSIMLEADNMVNINIADSLVTDEVYTYVLLDGAAKGNVNLDSNGTLVYEAGDGASGQDALRVRICNDCGNCTTDTLVFSIPEAEEPMPAMGEVTVFNAISASQDGRNDYLHIENIEAHPNNELVIYNRWGEVVFQIEKYDNTGRIFSGRRNVGGSGVLPNGTYYYHLLLRENHQEMKGFLVVK